MELTLNSEITIVFSNKEGEEVSIDGTLGGLIEEGIEYFLDQLEADECDCSFNESQNHCECNPKYEDYEFKEIVA